jgi:myo-inositol 2-dehydrogenase / D-chiro-inositol 1-dehydrogenase
MSVRIGLVGAGGIAPEHAQACQDLGHPFSVYARGHAKEFAGRYGIAEAATYDHLLDHSDIVVISAPTPAHEELVLTALVGGVHVICEKPLTLGVEASLRLAAAADRAGRLLLPAHVVRYFPAYAAIKERVEAGAVGRVTALRLSRRGASPATPWFHDEDASGGLVTDLMIHDYDQAAWLAGDVADVTAIHWYDEDGEHARVLLTHESGATSEVEGGWAPPGTPFRTQLHVTGDAGTLDHDSLAEADPAESPYTTQLRDLVSACTDGTTPRVTIHDGIRAVRVAEAVRTSLRSDEPSH